MLCTFQSVVSGNILLAAGQSATSIGVEAASVVNDAVTTVVSVDPSTVAQFGAVYSGNPQGTAAASSLVMRVFDVDKPDLSRGSDLLGHEARDLLDQGAVFISEVLHRELALFPEAKAILRAVTEYQLSRQVFSREAVVKWAPASLLAGGLLVLSGYLIDLPLPGICLPVLLVGAPAVPGLIKGVKNYLSQRPAGCDSDDLLERLSLLQVNSAQILILLARLARYPKFAQRYREDGARLVLFANHCLEDAVNLLVRDVRKNHKINGTSHRLLADIYRFTNFEPAIKALCELAELTRK